ncbi:MAG: ABC transporter substrate-binding protein, partial [Gammaproteobacteria bacterium]|nr:ABC transporter substrate-binding protein [Gammaproteobacteria bacterium]
IGINEKFWKGLSKSDQLMVEAASSMENDVMMSEYSWNNGRFLAKLQAEQGVKLRRFSDEIYDSFGEAAEEVFEEVVNHSDLAKRVHESFLVARAEVGAWQNIADVEYLRQRNRVLGIK